MFASRKSDGVITVAGVDMSFDEAGDLRVDSVIDGSVTSQTFDIINHAAPDDFRPGWYRWTGSAVELTSEGTTGQAAAAAAALAQRRADGMATLATRRFVAEEAGTAFNGSMVQTDRVTQAKITAAYVKAKADSAFTITNWKMAPGVFVTLDAASIVAVGDAILAHVQACFDHEAELSADIETAPDPSSVDIEAGWPS